MTALLFNVALAADPAGWATTGEIREIVSVGNDFAVDDEGTTLGQGAHLDQRVRVNLSHTGAIRHFETEWDLFSGQLAGDVWDLEDSPDERLRGEHSALTLAGFQPRKLSYGGIFGNTMVDLGLMTSHWGLGLIANDGAHKPLFGREDFGDRVLRIGVRVAPFKTNGTVSPTFLAFAIDTVYADDLARIWDGQLANQAILAILHKPTEGLEWGLYSVFRNQFEPGFEDSTQVGVLDATAHLPVPLSESFTLVIEGEAAGVLGRTRRAQSYQSPTGLQLQSGVVVTKTRLESRRLDLHLNLGLASGDSNPDDKASMAFTADRDFGVGMVMFDEVMGGIEAGTYALLGDPQYSGQPPNGADLITNEGAWRQSAYLQPAVSLRPVDMLEIRAGAVFAMSTAPIAQPFYTFRNGGVPRNHLDQEVSGRSLGTEIDWAVLLRPGSEETMESWLIRPTLEVQGGHAFMSEAMGGQDVTLIQSSLRVGW